MSLSVPSFPDKVNALSLGPILHAWSNKFKGDLLPAAQSALELVRDSIQSITDQQETLALEMAKELNPTPDQKAEQVRLAQLLQVQVATLERLCKVHSTLTAVSTASLIHGFTRGTAPVDSERNVTPSRKIGSGIGQVLDV